MGFKVRYMLVRVVFSEDKPYMDMSLQRGVSAQRWSAVIAAPALDAARSSQNTP